MGYRSQGTMVVAFESLADMKEVLAVYRLDPRVQKYNPFVSGEHAEVGTECWQFETWDFGDESYSPWYLMRLDFSDWKWYESYEDVQCFMHIADVCKQFAQERLDFSYAYRFVRGGEDGDDTEELSYGSDTPTSHSMVEQLEDALTMRIENSIDDDLEQYTTRQDPSSLGLGNINPSDVTRKTKENDNVNI